MVRNLWIPVLTLGLIACGIAQIAVADPMLPMVRVPQCPPGYLLVEEDLWSQLMDETGRHLDRARDAYLQAHGRTASIELRKAAVMMRIDAGHYQDRGDLALIRSAQELEHLAHDLGTGHGFETLADLDAASMRALHALAEHQQIRASLAWRENKPARAGRYLRAAADNLERAVVRSRVAISTATHDVIRGTRNLSVRLIDNTGFAIDEVGRGIDVLGKQIEHLGQTMMHPMRVPPRD